MGSHSFDSPQAAAEAVRRAMDTIEWFADSEERFNALTARLYEALPEMKTEAFWQAPPTLRLMCPSCGATITTIALYQDRAGRPCLSECDGRPVAVPADPVALGADPSYDVDGMPGDLTRERVVLACRLARCRYRQPFKRGTLLRVYFDAYLNKRDRITLP